MIYGLSVPGTLEDVAEVRILEWHGQPGRHFASGDLVVELETHKAVIEVRTEKPTVLRRVYIEAGEWQKIGNAIGLLSDTPDEELPDSVDDLLDPPMAFEIV